MLQPAGSAAASILNSVRQDCLFSDRQIGSEEFLRRTLHRSLGIDGAERTPGRNSQVIHRDGPLPVISAVAGTSGVTSSSVRQLNGGSQFAALRKR